MLDKRDLVIGQLAKSLGLVDDAALRKAAELKQKFPDKTLDVILVEAGLMTKDGRKALAQAWNERMKAGAAGAPAASATASGRTPAPRPAQAPAPAPAGDSLDFAPEGAWKGQAQPAAQQAPRPSAAPSSSGGLDLAPEGTALSAVKPSFVPQASSGSKIQLSPGGGLGGASSHSSIKPPSQGPGLGQGTSSRIAQTTPAPAAPPAPALDGDDLAVPDDALPELSVPLDDDIPAAPAAPGQTKLAPPKGRPLGNEAPGERTKPLPLGTPGKGVVPGGSRPALGAAAAKPPLGNEEAILAEPTLMMQDEELRKVPQVGAPTPRPPASQNEEAILGEETETLSAPKSGLVLKPKEDALPADLPELPPSPEEQGLEPIPEEAAPAAPASLEATEKDLASSDRMRVSKEGGILDRNEFKRRQKLKMGFEGLRVGDFEIVGELSRGAFGLVLKVRPESTAKTLARERGFKGEFMAMKVMLETNDPEETRRFMDEVKVLIDISHPNIIKIFDAGVEGGLKYYVMELIEGVDTRSLAREHGGKLPVLYATRIAKDVAEALATVHGKTIYHRDMKPANVMIDRAKQPYRTVLIDFGLVQKRDAKGDAGLVLGTPSYMPPEQAKPKGGFGEVNATSDIYSLGATFYFWLTGQSPFPGKDPREIIKRVCTDPPPELSELNAEVPKGIAAICMKCLAKKQRERYPSAKALAQELEKELTGAQRMLKAKGFMRKIFGGGGGGGAADEKDES